MGRRAFVAALSVALLASTSPGAWAQAPGACSNGTAPEESGPTDIDAVTGNGGLTAAANRSGTLTVLKWPSPSFYDQLDYRTTDRSLPRMGAEANDGAFLGLAWKPSGKGEKWHFSWLREWPTKQRFADDDGDEIVTTHSDPAAGLRVRVRDVVGAREDALLRAIRVTRTTDSRARVARLFSFANFNPVYSKTAGSPDDDWCSDDGNDQGATYMEGPDAIVHSASGVDESTGDSSSVALAMAFGRTSDGHSVGSDPTGSAYDDSGDSSLSNNTSASGQNDAALFDVLRLGRSRSASSEVIFTAGRSATVALETLKTIRRRSPREVFDAKEKWWRKWLEPATLPRAAAKSVVRLAKRSLITLRQDIDKQGLIVTSIATQSPLGLDWIRHGAYMNAALLAANHKRISKRHNRAYNELQVNIDATTTPRGNWPTSMYADGVPGSSTPYEIDGTGFGIWTLWDHFDKTSDIDYLAAVYPAIRRAADHLTSTCVDATTNLQCLAHEEDRSTPSQTLVGAQAAFMGVGAAAAAAKIAKDRFGHSAAKFNEWSARRAELRSAIEQRFYDEDCKCFTRDASIGGTLLWPVKLVRPGSKESDRQAEINWSTVRKAMNGRVRSGGMEARALLGNAYAWAGRKGKIEQLKSALEWMAEKRVTRGTGLLGGAWAVRKGRVEIMRSQPHGWHHAMFYLAALKAYGKTDYSF